MNNKINSKLTKLNLFLSLVLCVATLCVVVFGVYAAQKIEYTLDGNMQYLVNDAYVDITTKSYYSGNITSSDTTDLTPSVLKAKADELLKVNIKGNTEPDSLTFTKITDAGWSNHQNTLTDGFDTSNLNFSDLSLNFDTTKRVYYFVVHVENLSTAVNVYSKVLDNTTKNSEYVYYVSSNVPEITTQVPKADTATKYNLVIAVGHKNITRVSTKQSANVKYTIEIGIGKMPIDFYANGKKLTGYYNQTWSDFVTNNKDSGLEIKNSNIYVTSEDKALYYQDKAETSSSKIIEKRSYNLIIKHTLFYEPENTTTSYPAYIFMYLGGYGTNNMSPIRWRLISLDGESKLDITKYSAENLPTLKKGMIFLQETYISSEIFFYNSAGATDAEIYNQNYYESQIRTKINENNASYFGFDATEYSYLLSQSEMIGSQKTRLETIHGWTGSAVNDIYNNLPYTPNEATSLGTDKLFLLSAEEVGETADGQSIYFSTNEERKWIPAGSSSTSGSYWWLRSPYYDDTYGAYFIYSSGAYDWSSTYGNYGVRAAFQLAS